MDPTESSLVIDRYFRNDIIESNHSGYWNIQDHETNRRIWMKLDVLAFGAHRDDIELTCAGTVIKLSDQGYKTGIVDLTAGEMGTRGSAREREEEARQAAKILRVQCRDNLGIPDANIELTRENKLKVVKAIRKYRPRIVLLPYWEDRHPDHTHAGQLISEASFIAGLSKLDTGQPGHRPEKLLYLNTRF